MKKLRGREGAIEIASGIYPYTIRRSSKARRLNLRVKSAGEIEVVIPPWVSFSVAEQFMHRQKEWLSKTLQKQAALQPAHVVAPGALLPCFDEQLVLRISYNPKRKKSFISRQGNELSILCAGSLHAEKVLERWYRKQMEAFAAKEVVYFTDQVGVPLNHIRIMNAATRWGSCNAVRRSISINWRLALGPIQVARYVLAHEVAHVVERNHSQKFWQLVARLHPTASEDRVWLRQHGPTLQWRATKKHTP